MLVHRHAVRHLAGDASCQHVRVSKVGVLSEPYITIADGLAEAANHLGSGVLKHMTEVITLHL